MTHEEMKQKLEAFGPKAWIRALRDTARFGHHKKSLGYRVGHVDRVVPEYAACCIGVLAVAADVYHLDSGGLRVAQWYGGHSNTGFDHQLLPSWLDSQQQDDLITINDRFSTDNYSEQIAYIEANLVPRWEAAQAAASAAQFEAVQ